MLSSAPISPAHPVIDMSHVSVALRGRSVLTDVSLQIQPGEFVGVIGANGAGKTTLLRLLLGLLRPTEGKLSVLGRAAQRGHPAVGYVPQKRQIDPDTPMRGWDMVALGLDGARWGLPLRSAAQRATVTAALRAVDALSLAAAPIGKLSGGEQQRLLLAQALLHRPGLLLLDEPLASLDIHNQRAVVDVVARTSREIGAAVLLVAHDMAPLLPVMDRVLYLADGRAAIGTVDEVVQPDVLSQLYRRPVDVVRVRGQILVLAVDDPAAGNLSAAKEHSPCC